MPSRRLWSVAALAAASLMATVVPQAAASDRWALEGSFGAVGATLQASEVVRDQVALTFGYALPSRHTLKNGTTISISAFKLGARLGPGASGSGRFLDVYTGVAPISWDDVTGSGRGTPWLLGAGLGQMFPVAGHAHVFARVGFEAAFGNNWQTQPSGVDATVGYRYQF